MMFGCKQQLFLLFVFYLIWIKFFLFSSECHYAQWKWIKLSLDIGHTQVRQTVYGRSDIGFISYMNEQMLLITNSLKKAQKEWIVNSSDHNRCWTLYQMTNELFSACRLIVVNFLSVINSEFINGVI